MAAVEWAECVLENYGEASRRFEKVLKPQHQFDHSIDYDTL